MYKLDTKGGQAGGILLTVLAADMMAMSDRMLTGAEKASHSSATMQMIGNVLTKAVLVLDKSASTDVKINRPLCHCVQSAKAAQIAPGMEDMRVSSRAKARVA